MFSFGPKLVLTSQGISQQTVKPGTPIPDFYGTLKTELEKSGFRVIPFGYDWRLDNQTTAQRLSEAIEASGSAKVSIVAHSMGGIVAATYLQEFGGDKIDHLITMGTPFLGAVGAVRTLELGDTVDGILWHLMNSGFKQIYQNSPAWYQLLPSRKFFSNGPGTYITTVDAEKRQSFSTYDETLEFLSSRPWANRTLLDKAKNFTNTLDLEKLLKKVDAYFVIGKGHATIASLRFDLRATPGEQSALETTTSLNGDGGVLVESATIGGKIESIHPGHTLIIEEKHSQLPSNSQVIDYIRKIIAG